MEKIILPLMIFLLVTGTSCKKQEEKDVLLPGEEVISRYQSGKKKETAIFVGETSNRVRTKVFEYYESGEKKKEYTHKDNLFYGPFTYWYKNGRIFCEGSIENKVLNLTMVTGQETYYWPDGKKMLEAQTVDGRMKPGTHFIYRDENGKEYTEETRPTDLLKKTKALTDKWEAGKI